MGLMMGKTAAMAGILKGDVIVAIDDHQVTDIMSYMKALAAYSKGDSALVQIQRNGAVLNKPVKF